MPLIVPTHVNTYGRCFGMNTAGRTALFTSATVANALLSTTWAPAANSAMIIPFVLPWPYTVARLFWANGASVGGNSDIGIFTTAGAALGRAGSTANTGASALQYAAPAGGAFQLEPNTRYFLAYVNDGTTGRVMGFPSGAITPRAMGMLQQASAIPLPNPLTPAAITGSNVIPMAGFTNTASGF